MEDIVLISRYAKTLDRQAHALDQPACEDVAEVARGYDKSDVVAHIFR